MVRRPTRLFAFALAAALALPAAPVSSAPLDSMRVAQAAPGAAEAKPAANGRIKTWTKAKWNAAKAKWMQDRARWKQCQTELRGKKLSLHRARHFLEDCMTKR